MPKTSISLERGSWKKGCLVEENKWLEVKLRITGWWPMLCSRQLFQTAHSQCSCHCFFRSVKLLIQVILHPYMLHSWKNIYFWTNVFSILSHSLKGRPKGHRTLPFCWNISHTLDSCCLYYGVINVGREDIPQRRNVTLIYIYLKQALCPQQPSTLLKAHTCWLCSRNRNHATLFLPWPSRTQQVCQSWDLSHGQGWPWIPLKL